MKGACRRTTRCRRFGRSWQGSATRTAGTSATSTCTSRTATSATGSERIEQQERTQYSKSRKKVLLIDWRGLTCLRISSPTSTPPRRASASRVARRMIPGFKESIDKAAELGVESITIGMPHRGRLNVLSNVVRKPLQSIFNEFKAGPKPASDAAEGGSQYTGSGDVKYHLGTSYDRPTLRGGRIHLSLVANPSTPRGGEHRRHRQNARQAVLRKRSRRFQTHGRVAPRRRRLERPGYRVRDPGHVPGPSTPSAGRFTSW